MKTLLLSLILAVTSFAQTTIVLGTVTVPTEVRDAVETWRLGQWNDPATPITLTAGINASVTSVTVSNAATIVAGDQLLIDTEATTVASKAANVLTVTRAMTITVGAAHSSGAIVHEVKWPSSIALMREFVRNKVNEILAQQKPTTIVTQDAAISAAQAAKDTFLATTVQ